MKMSAMVIAKATVTADATPSDEMVETLRQPYTVALDQSALGRLGVKLGDKALYNGKTVTVAAVTTGYPNMMQPSMVMSRDTLRLLGEADTGPRVAPLMVKIADPARAETVAAQLNILADGKFEQIVQDRYATFDTGFGRDIETGRTSFRQLEKLVLTKLGEPTPKSGRQEYLENLLMSYLHG